MGGIRIFQQMQATGGQSQIQFGPERFVCQCAPRELIFALNIAVSKQTRNQGLNFSVHKVDRLQIYKDPVRSNIPILISSTPSRSTFCVSGDNFSLNGIVASSATGPVKTPDSVSLSNASSDIR